MQTPATSFRTFMRLLPAALLLIFALTSLRPVSGFLDEWLENLRQKLYTYSQKDQSSKLYLACDKTLYEPGEVIWFSVMNRKSNSLEAHNGNTTIQLINPQGNVEATQYLPNRYNGQSSSKDFFSGNFALKPDQPGGLYKLKVFLSNYSNNQSENNLAFEKEIQVQQVVMPRLKLTLDFEQKAYGPGSPVSAKVKAFTNENLPLSGQKIKGVVSLNGEKVQDLETAIDKNGHALVKFTLPQTLKSTDGNLNLIFQHEGLSESISRSIPIVLNKIDLSFFPEGGELVTNLESKLAFRALNEFKKPADVSGEVLDESGKVVASFSSFHDGMGEFNFKPLEGKSYTARLTNPAGISTQFPLPEAMAQGFVLQVARPEKEILKVNVRSTLKAKAGLIGQVRGQAYFQKTLDLKPGDNLVEISTAEMPIGVLQLTLFDQKTIERAERLVFVNNHKQLQLKVKTDKEKYLPREKVKLTISASDETGMPMPADVLVSVVDDQLLTFMNDKSSNILSWLLVETEIKGKVEEPRFYFDKTEPKAPVALDLLLKTAGWRRFTWETIKQVNLPHYLYSGEKLLSSRLYSTTYPSATSSKEVTGRVLINNTTEPLANATVTLIRNSNVLANTTTNETGHFKFTNLSSGKYDVDINLVGRTSALITAVEVSNQHSADLQVKFPLPDPDKIAKNKQNGVSVTYQHSGGGNAGKLSGRVIDRVTREPLPFANVVVKQNGTQKGYGQTDINGYYAISPLLPGTYTVEFPNVGYITKKITGLEIVGNKTTSLAAELQENTTMLSEVSVVAYEAPLISPSKVGETLSREQIQRFATREVSTLASTTANVMSRDDHSTSIRGTRNSGTVYYVNGVKQLVAPSLPAVSKAPKAVTTRNLDNQISGKTVAKTAQKPTEPHDYIRIREFAAPVYADSETVTERTDFRKTLFWQPFVQIGRNGVTTLEFYTGDAITSYNILVEGISADGSPGRNEHKFFSQLPFSLAAKLPQATLENDRISVPLILKNNTEKEVSGKLEIAHPAGWKFAGKIPAKHLIKPNSTQTLYLDYEVTSQTGAYDFAASFQADGLCDAFSQPVTVEQRGYPVSQSIAGNSKEADYQLDLSNMTAGTAQVSFVAYPSVIADLFKGIEGMLQEPYGCFEQTSSTSYPNLMVLDYLRETEKPDFTAMARAEDLLEKGYKRLVTFETKEKGYDWFGQAPGHEGLTAYGLLQFTDMQRVGGNVNAAMMARTKDWMLSRRDGNGGFKLSSGHGSSYGHADPAIANAYIVYALTEAGYKDLKPEMNAVYQSSLKSADPYQLALVSNALLASGDKNRGMELLANILPKQAPDGSWTGARHSVTRSSGKSLQVETTSLAVLAILKTEEKSQAALQKALKFLLQSRNGYGSFGSTQATVLALKAITEYSRISKQTAENGTVQFYVEKKKAGEKSYTATQTSEIVMDSLQRYFSKPGNYAVKVRYQKTNTALPYSLALNYFSNQPPSSPECKVKLETTLNSSETTVGNTIRYTARLKNLQPEGLPMTIAIIGIPAGTSVQPWQLKELQDKKVIAFYEITGNRLVCYLRDMAPSEEVVIPLDLKAEFPGTYESPASSAYIYYTNEYKSWASGAKVSIKP